MKICLKIKDVCRLSTYGQHEKKCTTFERKWKRKRQKKNEKCLSQSGYTCRRCLVCCVFVASFFLQSNAMQWSAVCKTIHCTAPVHSFDRVRCACQLCLFSSFGLFKKRNTHSHTLAWLRMKSAQPESYKSKCIHYRMFVRFN